MTRCAVRVLFCPAPLPSYVVAGAKGTEYYTDTNFATPNAEGVLLFRLRERPAAGHDRAHGGAYKRAHG